MASIQAKDIKSLNPRDQFAIAALSLLVQKYESTNAPISKVVERAYQYADTMLNESARLRNANNEGGGVDQGQAASGTSTGDTAIANALGVIAGKIEANKNKTELSAIEDALDVIKIDNKTANDKFKVEGGGGSITRDAVNNTADVTDVVVFNSAAGNAALRITLSALAVLIGADRKINWITQNNITDVESMNDALLDDYDTKGANYSRLIEGLVHDYVLEMLQTNKAAYNRVVQIINSI